MWLVQGLSPLMGTDAAVVVDEVAALAGRGAVRQEEGDDHVEDESERRR